MIQLVGVASVGGLLLVWLVYPLVMVMMASLRRGAPGATATDGRRDHPTVTVVLAARETPDAIRARVADILCQHDTPDGFEVVVAYDGPSPPPPSLVSGDPRVRVVPGDRPGGKAGALNAGVRAARGELLVFADSHQRFQPGAIARLVERMQDPRVGGVSGTVRSDDEGWSAFRAYWRCERQLRWAEAQVHSSVGVSGAIYALRRSLWVPLPAGLLLDDLLVPMNVVARGYRVAYAPEAQAVDYRRHTRLDHYRRKVRTLTGNIQLVAWYPWVLLPWRNRIWAQFVCHKLLRLFTPYWVIGAGVWFTAELVSVSSAAVPMVATNEAMMLAGAAGLLLVLIRSGRGALLDVLFAQAAVVQATIHGLRSHWNVWDP